VTEFVQAPHNVRITSFDNGVYTFNALASGVYVESGSADGPEVVRGRIRRLPAGGKVSANGTGRLPLTPPAVSWTVVFVAAYPAAQLQHINLMNLKGAYGTLTGRVSGTLSHTYYSAPAILVEVRSTWAAPYAAGTQNTLMAAIEFEMMEFWQPD
jgi:hypothetical protein